MGSLFQVLEKEYNKQKGLRQETLSIQQDLRMIAAAMDDRLHALGSGQRRTAVARLYSEEMLGLAHDAQDCIDRIVHRLTCRPSRGGGGGASPSALVRRVAHELKTGSVRSYVMYSGKFFPKTPWMFLLMAKVLNPCSGNTSRIRGVHLPRIQLFCWY